MAPAPLDAEIDANYDHFRRHFASIAQEQAQRFALIRHGRFEGFFDEVAEAAGEARSRFPDGVYSIQQVIEEPVDLGFFSHVGPWVPPRPTADHRSRRHPPSRCRRHQAPAGRRASRYRRIALRARGRRDRRTRLAQGGAS